MKLVTPETLAAGMREAGVKWPASWTDEDLAWVVRQVLAAIPPDPRLDALLAALDRLWQFYGPLEVYAEGERGMTQLDHGHEEYEALMDVRAASDALAAFEEGA